MAFKVDRSGTLHNGMFIVSDSGVRTKSRDIVWDVLCHCGRRFSASWGNLKKYTSCGCYKQSSEHRKNISLGMLGINVQDLSGMSFGRLVVCRDSGKRQGRAVLWECKCTCGKVVLRTSWQLHDTVTPSCGCYLKQMATTFLPKDQKGARHPCWKGGVSRTHAIAYKSWRYNQWRLAVYERDCFTCRKCGDDTGGNLNVHHLLSRMKHPSLMYSLRNGVTMCRGCHKEFHDTYGYNDAKPSKFKEFLCLR